MARIPFPETQHLPYEVRDLLRQANLNIFLMWAHSVDTVGIVAQLGAAQFAKLELPRSIRELVTLCRSQAWNSGALNASGQPQHFRRGHTEDATEQHSTQPTDNYRGLIHEDA